MNSEYIITNIFFYRKDKLSLKLRHIQSNQSLNISIPMSIKHDYIKDNFKVGDTVRCKLVNDRRQFNKGYRRECYLSPKDGRLNGFYVKK